MSSEKFQQVKSAYPAAELWHEGQQPIVYVPKLPIRARGRMLSRDVLLWPAGREGYATRLFVSEPIEAPNAKNWNVFSIAGGKWHACSWNEVNADLPWLEMILAHLRAFA